ADLAAKTGAMATMEWPLAFGGAALHCLRRLVTAVKRRKSLACRPTSHLCRFTAPSWLQGYVSCASRALQIAFPRGSAIDDCKSRLFHRARSHRPTTPGNAATRACEDQDD